MYLANKIKHLSAFCLVLIIIVMPRAVSTQEVEQARIKLEGTILNINKEVIPEAEVQLNDKESGQTFYSKSNKKGEFSCRPLPAGNYTLTVKKKGYKIYTGELKLGPNIIQKIEVILVEEGTLEQKKEEEAIAYFKKGVKLSRENQLEEAVHAFQKAVELKEDFFEAYVNLGTFLFQQQKDDEAERALLKALELRPEGSKPKEILAAINFEKAKILIKENKMDEALERLKQAYSFHQAHAYVNFLLGYLYDKKEMNDEAIKHFENFLRLAPNAPQAKDIKKILESLKRQDETLFYF
jgi:tetratricopeptide (TPR) repeat protein